MLQYKIGSRHTQSLGCLSLSTSQTALPYWHSLLNKDIGFGGAQIKYTLTAKHINIYKCTAAQANIAAVALFLLLSTRSYFRFLFIRFFIFFFFALYIFIHAHGGSKLRVVRCWNTVRKAIRTRNSAAFSRVNRISTAELFASHILFYIIYKFINPIKQFPLSVAELCAVHAMSAIIIIEYSWTKMLIFI